MPAPLKITLTDEEDRMLENLSYTDGVPRRTKQRALALRLRAHGWKIPQIADYLNWAIANRARNSSSLAAAGQKWIT